jgi:hypothetical protein
MTLRKTLTRTVLPLTALLLMALLIAACVAPVETGAADMMDDEMKVLTVAVGQEPTHLEATWVVLTVAVAQEPTHLEATLAAAAGETNCNGCLNVMESLVCNRATSPPARSSPCWQPVGSGSMTARSSLPCAKA